MIKNIIIAFLFLINIGQYVWLGITKEIVQTNFYSSVVYPMQLLADNVENTKDAKVLQAKLQIIKLEFGNKYQWNNGNTQLICSTYTAVARLDENAQ